MYLELSVRLNLLYSTQKRSQKARSKRFKLGLAEAKAEVDKETKETTTACFSHFTTIFPNRFLSSSNIHLNSCNSQERQIFVICPHLSMDGGNRISEEY
ncbi:hypothetical protein WN51_12467 [Melipona quadrifasciata]|uniref:Uncharacterized protein n=1 Tax=Melipona quadrifasciata TaxID=166423 RepID=A0A0M9A3J7_9HYME|nr:hypothetical protein WN51_12467 [Melipona quadrifasciata]